ncbi:MAG TPA: hemolysin family protein [Vicinamibacterales bacterium]|nr:hemolysin family protein [Vicinamibacterales bacterium]
MIPLDLFLLGAAAIYLGALESAFSALMRLSLRIAAERSDRPDALAGFLDEPLQLFIPIRVLLGLITAAATALIADAIGVGAAHKLTLIVASVVAFVIFCELLIPLLIIRHDPAYWLDLLLPTFVPVTRALAPLTRWIARGMNVRGPAVPIASMPEATPPETTDSAAPASNGGEAEDVVGKEERQLLQSIVDFGDTLVREVMTPRPDIVAIPESATIGQLRALFREQEYSRFPVFKESLDNIAGFVFVKDLVALGPADDARPIAPLVRPATVVPETKLVPELLKQFQRQQTQCAIVVDEYGGTAGLVTLEDLLEEIVGEIRDEYDVEAESVVDEGHGRFVFSGKVDIDAVAQRLDVDIEREGFETVGGYLLARIGRVPTIGERFEIDGLNVEVLEAERRRIAKVRMSKLEEMVQEQTEP